MDWKRPLPLWSLLLGILLAVSLTVGLLVVPNLVTPRPDFALVTNYPTLTVTAFYCGIGETSPCHYNATQMTIKPLHDFTGIVSLSEVSSGSAMIASFGSMEISNKVLLGPATNVSVFAESATIGNYTITITATSGAIVHSLLIPVAVQNITFTLSTTSLTIARGSSGTVQTDIGSVNRLAGNLTMQASVLNGSYGVDPYVNATFSASNVLLDSGGAARTTLTITVGQSAGTGLRDVGISVRKPGFVFGLGLSLTIV